jgi:hypothetical protein
VAIPDSDRARRPPLDRPSVPHPELTAGDRVEGLGDFGKPTAEFGTVERSNEDDAIVKWDGPVAQECISRGLRKFSCKVHAHQARQHLLAAICSTPCSVCRKLLRPETCLRVIRRADGSYTCMLIAQSLHPIAFSQPSRFAANLLGGAIDLRWKQEIRRRKLQKQQRKLEEIVQRRLP